MSCVCGSEAILECSYYYILFTAHTYVHVNYFTYEQQCQNDSMAETNEEAGCNVMKISTCKWRPIWKSLKGKCKFSLHKYILSSHYISTYLTVVLRNGTKRLWSAHARAEMCIYPIVFTYNLNRVAFLPHNQYS